MRITKVSGIVYRQAILHRPSVLQHAKVVRPWHDTLLVRIDTDDGLVGWGEAFGHFGVAATTLAALETVVAPKCVGIDPLAGDIAIEKLERDLHPLGRSGPVTFALSGVEIAMWDLRGKAQGVSVSTLLGGAKSQSLAAYASMTRYADETAVCLETLEATRQGYASVKLHEIDPSIIRAAAIANRESGLPLTVDANCAWTLAEAMSISDQMSDLGIYWLEEPIWPPEDTAALLKLRAHSTIPLAVGENASSVLDFGKMLEAKALSYAQPSVTKIGGISAMRRIFEKAIECNADPAPHSPYFGPGLAATLHVCAALSPDTWIEHLFYDLEVGPFGDVLVPRNGRFAVPDRPGLGVEPDLAVLDACRIR